MICQKCVCNDILYLILFNKNDCLQKKKVYIQPEAKYCLKIQEEKGHIVSKLLLIPFALMLHMIIYIKLLHVLTRKMLIIHIFISLFHLLIFSITSDFLALPAI